MFTNIFNKIAEYSTRNQNTTNKTTTKISTFVSLELFIILINYIKNIFKKKSVQLVNINNIDNKTIEKYLYKKSKLKNYEEINKRFFYIREEFFEAFNTYRPLFKTE